MTTRIATRPAPTTCLDRMGAAAQLLVVFGGLVVVLSAFASLLTRQPWLLTTLVGTVLALLVALVVPPACDAARVAQARVLPRSAARAPLRDVRAIVLSVALPMVALLVLVAVLTDEPLGSAVATVATTVLVTSAAATAAAGWAGLLRRGEAVAAAAALVLAVGWLATPWGCAIALCGPTAGSIAQVVGLAVVAGLSSVVVTFAIVRRWPGTRTRASRGSMPTLAEDTTPGQWWRRRRREWTARRQSTELDAEVLAPAFVVTQFAIHAGSSAGGTASLLWRPWGSDVTVIWPLWIAALVALALTSLRGADLHWRHRLAPGGVRQARLADALVVGTLRWLVAWFGGCVLVAGALWLLLTDAGAAARQQGALAIAGAAGSSVSVLLLELVLAVAVAVWLRALSPRPEPVRYGALGVFLLGFAVYGWAVLTAPFNGRPPFDDPALVIGTRGLAHAMTMVVAIAAVLLLARWQWRRVDWLGRHLARRTRDARSGDDA